MKKYDINGFNFNKKNWNKLDKIEKMIFSDPKLLELKEDNYKLYPLEVCTLITSISSRALTHSADSEYEIPLTLLSNTMLVLSIGIGSIILRNTKLINKLKKERDLKIENHRSIK